MLMHLSDYLHYSYYLILGLRYTLEITVYSLIIATPLGLFWTFGRNSKYKTIKIVFGAIIDISRGLPHLVLLFYVYFVFPEIGIDVTAVQAAVIGLSFAYSTYLAEIYRSGLESVPRGQLEAAKSIGMTTIMSMRRVVLPQAVRVVIPPYANIAVMVLKESSLASTIAVSEMTREANLLVNSTFDALTIYTLLAIFYLAFSIPLIQITKLLEKKFNN